MAPPYWRTSTYELSFGACDGPLAHRLVPSCRRVEVTVAPQFHRSQPGQAPPEVRVFAVEGNGGVEAADLRQRLAPDRKIASVEHDADPEHVFDQHVGEGADGEIVRPQEQPASPVPVEESIVALAQPNRAAW